MHGATIKIITASSVY